MFANAMPPPVPLKINEVVDNFMQFDEKNFSYYVTKLHNYFTVGFIILVMVLFFSWRHSCSVLEGRSPFLTSGLDETCGIIGAIIDTSGSVE